jgi:hypothetical protein
MKRAQGCFRKVAAHHHLSSLAGSIGESSVTVKMPIAGKKGQKKEKKGTVYLIPNLARKRGQYT